MDKIPGPWKKALPVVGNVLECLRPDFHKVLLKWADDYGERPAAALLTSNSSFWAPTTSRA